MATTLVTGGSGTLGRNIVRLLVEAGTETRVLSRRSAPVWPNGANWFTGDLTTGHGIKQALDGCTTVVHCASDTRSQKRDVVHAGNLLSEATRAGAQHVIYISIVGCDRAPYRYYRDKATVEELVEESGIEHTILRATQFHELLTWVLDTVRRSPFIPVPARTYLQPVAAAEVVERIVQLTRSEPQGRAPDFGGPEIRTASELANMYLVSRRARTRATSVPLPGGLGSALRAGALLAPDHRAGHQTWEEHLRETINERTNS